MFNKNQFKIQFSEWAADNPTGTIDEARAFCAENIPAEHMKKFGWLQDQSVQWFEWAKAQRQAESSFNSEAEGDIL